MYLITDIPANSQYIYALDSTYHGLNVSTSTTASNRAAGPARGLWAGKRYHVTVYAVDDAVTLYLDYLLASGAWSQDVMASSVGNCTADTLKVFDLAPEAGDFRFRILAAADNPTTLAITITESIGVET